MRDAALIAHDLALAELGAVDVAGGILAQSVGLEGDGEAAVGTHGGAILVQACAAVLTLAFIVFRFACLQFVAQPWHGTPVHDAQIGVVEGGLVQQRRSARHRSSGCFVERCAVRWPPLDGLAEIGSL